MNALVLAATLVVLSSPPAVPVPATRPAPAAADSVVLTLPEALRQALQNNPQFLSATQLDPIARGRWRQTRAAVLPKLSALAFDARQSVPDMYQRGGASVLSGGVLFAERITAERVTLSQSLVNLQDFASASAADRNARAARSDVEKARVDLVAQVKRSFYDLLLSGELVDIARSTVDQVERQLAQARLNEKAGSSALLDVLRAEVQLANVKPQLIQATHDREIAGLSLASLLGLDPATRIETRGVFLEPQAPPEKPAVVARALAARPDLEAARLRLAAARRSLRSARAGYLPNLTASAQYERSKGQRYPLDTQIETTTATVTVNVPIFDGLMTAGRVQEARAQESRAATDLRALELSARLDIEQALALVDQARAVLEATDAAVRQATQALAIAESGYRLGARTYLELLDTQLALAQARTNRARSQRDYAVAVARLDQAQGLVTGLEEPVKSQMTRRVTP